MIRPYVEVARRSFERYSTYRVATAAGVFTNTVFGFLRAYILLAVYRSRTNVGGFDAVDVVTYTFVTQGLFATVGVGNSLLELADRIPTGDVVTDLSRPLHFQSYWMSGELGRSGYQALFRGVPPVLIGAAFFTLRYPRDLGVIAAFAVSTLLAVEISFCYRFLVSLTGFWLLDTRGAAQLATIVMGFFSGFIVPLVFFPAGLERVARVLPFASVVELPIELFLGKHRGLGPTAAVLGTQLAWAVVLFALGEVVVARALRKVIVQGG